jgi:hypothetical protein
MKRRRTAPLATVRDATATMNVAIPMTYLATATDAIRVRDDSIDAYRLVSAVAYDGSGLAALFLVR